MSQTPCLLCATAAEAQSESKTFSKWVRCPACGTFQISGEAADELARDPVRRAAVAGVLRERRLGGATEAARITREAAEALAAYAPRRVSDVLDRTLLNVARATKRPGAKVHIDT